MDEEIVNELAAFDWSTLPALLQDKGMNLGVDLGIKVATALGIFLVGKFAVRLVVSAIAKLMQKQEVDKTLETFICNLVRTALMIVVVIAAIGAIGIQTTSFIAIFGAAGLAVGLALQGSLSNFASGVLIVLFRPYRVGDWIEAAGISGSVEQVQISSQVRTGLSLKSPCWRLRRCLFLAGLEILLIVDPRIRMAGDFQKTSLATRNA